MGLETTKYNRVVPWDVGREAQQMGAYWVLYFYRIDNGYQMAKLTKILQQDHNRKWSGIKPQTRKLSYAFESFTFSGARRMLRWSDGLVLHMGLSCLFLLSTPRIINTSYCAFAHLICTCAAAETALGANASHAAGTNLTRYPDYFLDALSIPICGK
jgi:hypothetical protein